MIGMSISVIQRSKSLKLLDLVAHRDYGVITGQEMAPRMEIRADRTGQPGLARPVRYDRVRAERSGTPGRARGDGKTPVLHPPPRVTIRASESSGRLFRSSSPVLPASAVSRAMVALVRKGREWPPRQAFLVGL